jgi:exonuclease SbcD
VALKLLFSGDLHLGRRSSRIPSIVDGRRASAAHAWERMVDVAVRDRVELVLLSGDVVDQDNRFYEAIGPLERGLARLGQAGIRTLAVAGNHDYEVLARLAQNLDRRAFTLLGAGARWQKEIINIDGRPALAIDGWSFAGQYADASPLETYAPPSDRSIPTLVMVHGELDNPASRYGPLDRARMLNAPVAGWLIGHVHAPSNIREDGGPFILNPGSPQALDPGEPGVHGPWLIELAPGQPLAYRQLPLSTVRYEGVRVTLEHPADRSALDTQVMSAIRDVVAKVSQTSASELPHLAIRLTIGGSVAPPLMKVLPNVAQELSREGADLGTTRCPVSVEKVILDVTPSIDLVALAKERNAAAELARLVLALDGGQALADEYEALVNRLVEQLQAVHGHRDFGAVVDDSRPTPADAKRMLRRQANKLIAALMAGGEPE